MASLCISQQYVFETYLALTQRIPVGGIDLTKFRKFVHECETANSLLEKIGTDVIEAIFNRSVSDSARRLDFESFEKAVIMYALVVDRSSANPANVYIDFVTRTILRLPSLVEGKLSKPASLEKICLIADALLEKSLANCFTPTVSVTMDSLKQQAPGLFAPDPVNHNRPPPANRSAVASLPPMPVTAFPRVNECVQASAPPTPLPVVHFEYSQGMVQQSPPVKPDVEPLPSVPISELSNFVGFPNGPYRAWCERDRRLDPKSTFGDKFGDPEVAVPSNDKESVESVSDRFASSLLQNFGTMSLAFKYFCSCMNRSAKSPTFITCTKFLYGCESIGFTSANLKALFRYIDYHGDGVVDSEEWTNWGEYRKAGG